MEEIKNTEINENPKPGTKDALKAENVALEAEIASLKAQLEAARVQHSPESEGVQAAPKAAAPAKRMVKIKLPLTRAERNDVFVGLNGKTYLIKRGVEVEVPYGVAKVLERREKMLSVAMEYEAQASAPLEELAKMYQ